MSKRIGLSEEDVTAVVLGTTLVAHVAYGAVLGWLVERWAYDAEATITLLRPIQVSASEKMESAV